MYGMIHRGVRDMLIAEAGEAAWTALERNLGLGPQHQISALVYDDDLTVAIVAAAAELLQQPVETCLHAFGRHWIRFAERGSFGAIMEFTGKDLPGFIANLDRMHQAVVAAMPEARVPSFSLTASEPGYLRVRYASDRPGLEPFVAGLLDGLIERFGQRGTVSRVPGLDHPEFELRYKRA